MSEEEYRKAEEGLNDVLELFRRHDSDLRVSEIRLKASLEALRAEILKLALQAREERLRPPFRVIHMDEALARAGKA